MHKIYYVMIGAGLSLLALGGIKYSCAQSELERALVDVKVERKDKLAYELLGYENENVGVLKDR